MRTRSKILLAVATLLPFLYILFFIGFMIVSVLSVSMRTSSGKTSHDLPINFVVLFILHLSTMLWTMGLTAFYIVNVFRNRRIDNDKKALWAVVIFMGNLIAMPVYWYLYIWCEDTNTNRTDESDCVSSPGSV